MSGREPQVGDTITTAEELDALLSSGAVVLDARGDAYLTGAVTSRYAARFPPLTILYIPGHPPRPEREVKAEALRDAELINPYGLRGHDLVAEVAAERESHAARGYDAHHDARHGIDHLHRWAEHYASLRTREGVIKAASLVLAAADLREALGADRIARGDS